MAATLEKAITYVFGESQIRNAEARSSTLLCSTNKPAAFKYLQPQSLTTRFLKVTNTWPEKTAHYGRKRERKVINGNRMGNAALATHCIAVI